MEVLLFKSGSWKWICSASEILNEVTLLSCDKIEKLLKLTDVGAVMANSGWLGIALIPTHTSVCFLILLCSILLMEFMVVADKPAWHRLLDIRQRVVDPMYDNWHLSHTYLYTTHGFIRRGNLSLYGNKCLMVRVGFKITLSCVFGKKKITYDVNGFLIWGDIWGKKGKWRTQMTGVEE